jgi:hypothetical protein
MILTPFLAATLLATAPLQVRAGAPPASANTSPETAEGVEILRRVLVEALDKAFEEKDKDERGEFRSEQGLFLEGRVTSLWAGGRSVQHARAFHMPGAGLFFALDLSLPVIKKERDETGTDQPQDDEWERARSELRGTYARDGVALRRLYVGDRTEGEIDPKAIERATDTLLRTLARHVGRIEGLDASETITVALRLSGSDRSWLHEWSTDEPHGLYSLSTGEGEDSPRKAESMAFSALVLATGQEVRQQNLVVQVGLADLTAPDLASPEALRRRARINRY